MIYKAMLDLLHVSEVAIFHPKIYPPPTKKPNPKTDLSAGLRKETPDRVLRYLLEKWDKSKGIIL